MTAKLEAADHAHLECRLARSVQAVKHPVVALEAHQEAVALPHTPWVVAAGRRLGSKTRELARLRILEVEASVALPHTEDRRVTEAARATAAGPVTAEEPATAAAEEVSGAVLAAVT